MKKASKIILIICGAFNIIGVIASLAMMILGIVYCFLPLPAVFQVGYDRLFALVQQALADAGQEVPVATLESIVKIAYMVSIAITYFFRMIFFVILAIISFVGANAKKKGILIANIVFGVLTFNLLNIVGAILGIIGLSKEKKEEIKEEPEVIEEKK